MWSAGACLHAACGWATENYLGLHNAHELLEATGDVAMTIATVSVYFFLAARTILALGEAGNFPAAIKVTAEYFPSVTAHTPPRSSTQVRPSAPSSLRSPSARSPNTSRA